MSASLWSRWGGISATVFGTLIATLVFQEFAVRLALPAYNPAGHLKFDKARGSLPPLGRPGLHRQINNVGDYDVTVSINRFGFRDEKDLQTSTADDWFVVGDSYAFGWGVDERRRFSNLLEQKINQRVFNIASPTNLDSYPKAIDYAIANGARIGRVIVALNMSDDFAFDGGNGEIKADAPLNPSGPSMLPTLKGFLLDSSSLYFLATSLVHGSSLLKTAFVRLGLIAPGGQAPAGDVTAVAAQRGTDILLDLSRRFDVTVLIIPDSARWLGPERQKAIEGQVLVESSFRAHGLKVVSPLSAMERDSRPLDYLFRGDRHWNAAGHELAASILAHAIRP